MMIAKSNQNGRNAFTLIEIMLVIMIIGVMSAVVGPKLIGRVGQTKIKTTRNQMHQIHVALTDFEISVGRLPTSTEGIEALVQKPSGLTESEWPEKFMMNVPRDAWGERFIYRIPSEHKLHFDLVSMGPDKILGTSDDIGNWDLIPQEDL